MTTEAQVTQAERLADLISRAKARAHHHFLNTVTHDLFIELAQAVSRLPRDAAPAGQAVAWTIPGDDQADCYGFIPTKVYKEGEFTKPLYASPPAPPAGDAGAHNIADIANYGAKKLGEIDPRYVTAKIAGVINSAIERFWLIARTAKSSADTKAMREALQIALEQATEAFDYAKDKDDHALCEMRYRTFETALASLSVSRPQLGAARK